MLYINDKEINFETEISTNDLTDNVKLLLESELDKINNNEYTTSIDISRVGGDYTAMVNVKIHKDKFKVINYKIVEGGYK